MLLLDNLSEQLPSIQALEAIKEMNSDELEGMNWDVFEGSDDMEGTLEALKELKSDDVYDSDDVSVDWMYSDDEDHEVSLGAEDLGGHAGLSDDVSELADEPHFTEESRANVIPRIEKEGVQKAQEIVLPKGFLPPLDWDGLSPYEKQRSITVYLNKQSRLDIFGADEMMQLKPPRKRRNRSVPTVQQREPSSRTKRKVDYNEDQAFRDNIAKSQAKRGRIDEEVRLDVAELTVQVMNDSSVGDTWKGAVQKSKQVDLLQKNFATNEKIYTEIWFAFPDSQKKGLFSMHSSELPRSLLEVLVIKRSNGNTYNGQPLYDGVTVQSGGKQKKRFKGFQVQLWNTEVKQLVRLGLVSDTYMGAIMIALADVDNRLFSQANMYQFMFMMAARKDVAVNRWKSEVHDRLGDHSMRVSRGGRKRGEQSRLVEADSFLQLDDSVPADSIAEDTLRTANDNKNASLAGAGQSIFLETVGEQVPIETFYDLIEDNTLQGVTELVGE